MRKITIGILALLVGLFVALLAAILSGRQEPIPSRLEFLHLTDCKTPCWLGIMPGITTPEEAQARLQMAYGTNPAFVLRPDPDAPRSMYGVTVYPRDNPDGWFAVTLFSQDKHTVDTILLRFAYATQHNDKSSPTIGELYSMLGRPSWFGFTPNAGYFVMVYGDDTQGIRLFASPQRRVDWSQPLRWLVLYRYANHQALSSVDDLYPWLGFTTVRRYLDLQPPPRKREVGTR